jgi:hypothetical protein
VLVLRAAVHTAALLRIGRRGDAPVDGSRHGSLNAETEDIKAREPEVTEPRMADQSAAPASAR